METPPSSNNIIQRVDCVRRSAVCPLPSKVLAELLLPPQQMCRVAAHPTATGRRTSTWKASSRRLRVWSEADRLDETRRGEDVEGVRAVGEERAPPARACLEDESKGTDARRYSAWKR